MQVTHRGWTRLFWPSIFSGHRHMVSFHGWVNDLPAVFSEVALGILIVLASVAAIDVIAWWLPLCFSLLRPPDHLQQLPTPDGRKTTPPSAVGSGSSQPSESLYWEPPRWPSWPATSFATVPKNSASPRSWLQAAPFSRCSSPGRFPPFRLQCRVRLPAVRRRRRRLLPDPSARRRQCAGGDWRCERQGMPAALTVSLAVGALSLAVEISTSPRRFLQRSIAHSWAQLRRLHHLPRSSRRCRR